MTLEFVNLNNTPLRVGGLLVHFTLYYKSQAMLGDLCGLILLSSIIMISFCFRRISFELCVKLILLQKPTFILDL